jgi:hypothetical protein
LLLLLLQLMMMIMMDDSDDDEYGIFGGTHFRSAYFFEVCILLTLNLSFVITDIHNMSAYRGMR